jgi:hypothetical protein
VCEGVECRCICVCVHVGACVRTCMRLCILVCERGGCVYVTCVLPGCMGRPEEGQGYVKGGGACM